MTEWLRCPWLNIKLGRLSLEAGGMTVRIWRVAVPDGLHIWWGANGVHLFWHKSAFMPRVTRSHLADCELDGEQ